MRGSPLLSALAAFFAIALIGWPISKLTWAKSTLVPVERFAPAASGQAAKVRVEIDFTRAPESVRIVHLENTVLEKVSPGVRLDGEIAIAWPEEGVDLVFEVDWRETDTLNAARVMVVGPDGEEQSRSIWARGKIEEVLTF